jgi:1-acyl-sn-glycerol-3-phosphate acyltransferase
VRPPEFDPAEDFGSESWAGGSGSALGHDPFGDPPVDEPFVARLDVLETATFRAPSPTPLRVPQTKSARRGPRAAEPRSRALPPRKRWVSAPALSEIELPKPTGVIDRLLGDDVRRVLLSFQHLVDTDSPLDRFGFSPDTTRAAFPFFQALYSHWFRVTSKGHEHIPEAGPAILASNHGGLLPFDAAMTIVDVALHSDPPRLTRAIVDRWAGSLPWVNIFFARMGQVTGTRENFEALLEQGQAVLVFPEGIDGARKPIAQRYRVQGFHVGFIEHSLRSRTPIVPMAVIGSDDQAPILYDIKPIAKRLGLPVAPITPTFPWLGPVGLLPYPVPYRIVYGEPLDYHKRFGPEGADDARLVHYLSNQVRRKVQLLLDRNR